MHPALPSGIQLRRVSGWRKPPHTMVVTRASRWGNPFAVGKPSIYGPVPDATTAVAFFKRWLANTEEGRAYLSEAQGHLTGYNLACFCPLGSPCHRDVLLALLNPNPQAQ